MLGEWHGSAVPVMPVRHDVHGSCRAALRAQEAAGDGRPRQIAGQCVEPDVNHAVTTPAARALDVAGHVTVGDPFRWSAKRPPVC